MFEGFAREDAVVDDGVRLAVWRGGSGPPILLLHGYPQTHAIWHLVAPRLAERFTVVCPDLRGYGDSEKPCSGRDHSAYSKRTMARDQLATMHGLGFDAFAVGAHDRGARVALRLALDHPEAVSRLAILDIIPTATIYATLDRQRATTVWRYFFLIQPEDMPERLIGADPLYYLHRTLHEWSGTRGTPTAEAVAEYERCFDAATVHATCEDYRAGASIDLIHDEEDAEESLRCPTLVLWSRDGIGANYDVAEIWGRRRAPDLRCRALDCGHFIPEERPEQTATELLEFFGP